MKNIDNARQGWNFTEVCAWRHAVEASGKKRDYQEIISHVSQLPASTHTVQTYAVMDDGNPAFRITVGNRADAKPQILITGGVHGYEPSGVSAALQFVDKVAPSLTSDFNFVVYPCLSPWAFEHDQRWNAQAEDPNRLFTRAPSPPKDIFRTTDIEECRNFMTSMEQNGTFFSCAVDMHETVDRDIELRVLRSERFGEALATDYTAIPQGYYLTLSKRDTDAANAKQLAFGAAILSEVKKISPIAPEKTILNGKENLNGIILSAPAEGLMRTYLDKYAALVAVTEVYPDHKAMTPEKSVETQIASIRGALNYVLRLS